MICYHTITTYHILESVLHKANYRPDEEAILLIPSIITKLPAGIANNNQEFFCKILRYDWDYIRYDSYPDDVFLYIEKTLEKQLSTNWKTEITEFNVFNAARFFGSFLVDNEIKFNWFEEADGRFSSWWYPMEDEKRLYRERYELAHERGTYNANNKLIENIYVSKKTNKTKEYPNNTIDFDTCNELNKLTDNDLEKLLKFWNIDNLGICVPESGALLLTQHFCNIKLIGYEEHMLMYQMFLDYFLSDKIVLIKRHPSDLCPYEYEIDDVKVIEIDCPSELLQYVFKNRFDCVASISSTGIKNLKRISDREILLNQEFIYDYKECDIYYTLSQIVKKIKTKKIISHGINIKLLEIMLQNEEIDGAELISYEDINELKGDAIFVVGSNTSGEIFDEIMKYGNDNRFMVCFFCLNGYEKEYEFIKNNLLTVIQINTYEIGKKETYISKNILIASNNENTIKELNDMTFYKVLKRTGLEVCVEPRDDLLIQKSIVQGMLEASEKALEKQLEINKALEDELNKSRESS